MNLDLRITPFSRYGSYFTFSHLAGSGFRPKGSFIDFARPVKLENMPEGVYLQTVHGDSPRQEVFHLGLLRDGHLLPGKEVVTPSVLRLEDGAAFVEVCIAEQGMLRVRGRGIGLRLTLPTGVFDHAFPAGGKRWEVDSFSNRYRYALLPLAGRLAVDAPWDAVLKKSEHVWADFLPGEGGAFEGVVEEYTTSWQERGCYPAFADCVAQIEEEVQEWLSRMPSAPADFAAARDLAAYVNWSCVVAPRGNLKRPAMFMSKGIMSSVWSWDHCFNAMALIYHDPALAWEQFILPFDHQDANGCLPDLQNDGSLMWNFTKPPIHGWALRWMMERTDFIDEARLKYIYAPLSRWTEWWLAFRDDDRDGISQYNHGNDCGWDNATVFDDGAPVESPDLPTFLILQMETLAQVAQRLGYAQDEERWLERSQELLEKLLRHSWQGDHFISPRSDDHHVSAGDCLINFLPILLGRRLPEAVLASLVMGLKAEGRFITGYGLATENLSSPFYQADGYWRGPIWAPTTLILVDALAQIGETSLARELSRRYCHMVAASGMAENFDALTGAGLRDRSYTWTSSVFLVLAHEYIM